MFVSYILSPPFIPIVAYDKSITLHLASKHSLLIKYTELLKKPDTFYLLQTRK